MAGGAAPSSCSVLGGFQGPRWAESPPSSPQEGAAGGSRRWGEGGQHERAQSVLA